MASTLVAGGILGVLSIAIPHENPTYDGHYFLVSMSIVAFGVTLRLWTRHERLGVPVVHGVSVVVSAFVLALAWFGMVDVAGIHAVLLLIPLAISASFGPLRWSILLVAMQSLGYASVLATADTSLGLDRTTQWLVITLGLAVGLLYHDLVRRQIAIATLREFADRAERDAHREAHALRLQLLNDELAAANDLKDRFVAMASHELRTPLTSISGFSTTMVDRWHTLQDAEKLRFIRIIEAQSDRLGRLVSDLLTLARIEEGRIATDATPIDLAPVLRSALVHLDLDDVVTRCDPDARVAASADHVTQILLNLLGNASTYGGTHIAVTATYDPITSATTIVVADGGPGVDPGFVPDLFRRFTRGNDTADTGLRAGGSGLGLSIVEGLATAYGGEVWYEPNDPKGSSFHVRLPSEPPVS